MLLSLLQSSISDQCWPWWQAPPAVWCRAVLPFSTTGLQLVARGGGREVSSTRWPPPALEAHRQQVHEDRLGGSRSLPISYSNNAILHYPGQYQTHPYKPFWPEGAQPGMQLQASQVRWKQLFASSQQFLTRYYHLSIFSTNRVRLSSSLHCS